QHLEEMPNIIFATAYDQYALRAFEVHALDYLLKPYTRTRFADAMQKATTASVDYISRIQELVSSLNEKETYLENVLVSTKNKLISIQTTDIIWIEASGDYAKLILKDCYYLSKYGISQLEKKMNPQLFTKVHRSAIINVNRVREVYKYPSGYEIVMINGDQVKVSRSYLDNIRELIV
ncbi:MAG: LytTR family DNA-binding domain-containing protein, partial [Bacteroidota bacterium]